MNIVNKYISRFFLNSFYDSGYINIYGYLASPKSRLHTYILTMQLLATYIRTIAHVNIRRLKYIPIQPIW